MSSKSAVVVGKVELKPRREVVIEKKAAPAPKAEAKPQPRQERKPGRRQQEYDPRVANQQVFQELQYVKKQLAQARADAEAARSYKTALAALVNASEGFAKTLVETGAIVSGENQAAASATTALEGAIAGARKVLGQ